MAPGDEDDTEPTDRTPAQRILAYFGFVTDDEPRALSDPSGAERAIAVAGWVIFALAVGLVRGQVMALLAAASIFPVAVLTLSERQGWRGFALRHPVLNAVATIPTSFFAAALLLPLAPLTFCAGLAVPFAIVVFVLARRRQANQRPADPTRITRHSG